MSTLAKEFKAQNKEATTIRNNQKNDLNNEEASTQAIPSSQLDLQGRF